jgi:hypothetical protein
MRFRLPIGRQRRMEQTDSGQARQGVAMSTTLIRKIATFGERYRKEFLSECDQSPLPLDWGGFGVRNWCQSFFLGRKQ